MSGTSPIYRPRNPRDSTYYRCVEDHFERFDQAYEERFERQYGSFRPYVKHVIYRYLDCGILHNGFARVRCEECGHEHLLAFSCKSRHFCFSCHQKRVVEFGNGSVQKYSNLCHTAILSSAYQRYSGDTSFTIEAFSLNLVAAVWNH